jgi:predicted TIM-barrel fold metal-dependent hydrolase
MDWKGVIEEERAALMRLVALLCALAGLAELAASRSPAMRGFVLWILRRAEAAARDFVAGGPDTRLAPMPVRPAGAHPADAMQLAASLRALARQLEHQARLMPAACGGGGAQPEPPPLRRLTPMRGVARTLSVLTAFARPTAHPAPDTS